MINMFQNHIKLLDSEDSKHGNSMTCLKAWLQTELSLSQGNAVALEVSFGIKSPRFVNNVLRDYHINDGIYISWD